MNRTPLILAIASKQIEIANILIDRGAKLNTQDSQGNNQSDRWQCRLINLLQFHIH